MPTSQAQWLIYILVILVNTGLLVYVYAQVRKILIDHYGTHNAIVNALVTICDTAVRFTEQQYGDSSNSFKYNMALSAVADLARTHKVPLPDSGTLKFYIEAAVNALPATNNASQLPLPQVSAQPRG